MMTNELNKRMVTNFSTVMASLDNESERGAVIVAVAWMDDLLAEAPQKRLLPSPTTDDHLFTSHGPLGTLAAKIDMAYRVSLIREEPRRSLHICRRLRNDFAHISNPLTFETASIKDRVFQLFELNETILITNWTQAVNDLPSHYKKRVDMDDPGGSMRRLLDNRTLFDLVAGTLVTGLTMVAEQADRLAELE